MPNVNYKIDRIYEEATRLRDDLNYVLEMLEGTIKSHPGKTVEMIVEDVTLRGDWSPCENPPCRSGGKVYESAAEVVDRRGKNLVAFLLTLSALPDIEFEYYPASIPEKVTSLEAIETT